MMKSRLDAERLSDKNGERRPSERQGAVSLGSILIAPLSQRPRCVATVTREVIVPALLDIVLVDEPKEAG